MGIYLGPSPQSSDLAAYRPMTLIHIMPGFLLRFAQMDHNTFMRHKNAYYGAFHDEKQRAWHVEYERRTLLRPAHGVGLITASAQLLRASKE